AAPVILSTRIDVDRVQIKIEDGGVGISGEDLARVFDPYFTTKRGGTGLGLPIAKNIVEGLGGTIAVSSIPGHRTQIRVEFPVKRARTADRSCSSTMRKRFSRRSAARCARPATKSSRRRAGARRSGC